MSNMANDYYLRDVKMNLNPEEVILQNMKKLGYYNVNKTMLYDRFIKQYIKKVVDNDLDYSKPLQNYIEEYKQTEDYNMCMDQINRQVERSLELQKFLNTTNLKEFYEDCTEDELYYLGY